MLDYQPSSRDTFKELELFISNWNSQIDNTALSEIDFLN